MSNISLQCLVGVQCNDFAMIAADQIYTYSVCIMKDDTDKIYKISDRLIMGVNGEQGDVAQFSQFIAKNIHLYKMRNRYQLSAAAAVHFTRLNLVEALKSSSPYMINMLVAGYDEVNGGHLYYLDHLASCLKVPYACHGLGGIFNWGILQQNYSPDLTEEKAYDLLKLCVKEIQKRFLLNLPNFQVTVVNKNGVNTMPVINSALILGVK